MSAARLRRLREVGLGGGGPGGGAPDDLDLMLYFDGELDDERAKEVEAFLRTSGDARQKMAALDLGASLVRDKAREREEAAPDLVEAVMARIALEGRVPEATQVADEPSADVSPPPSAPAAPESARPRMVAPQGPASRPAANDNGRRIFVLAAMAVAAAAALMLWARTDTVTPPTSGVPSTGSPVAVTAPTERPTSVPSDQSEPPTPDQDVDVGVEVATVDFGSQSGAIFYVPGDSAAAEHSTTVVWLAETGGE